MRIEQSRGMCSSIWVATPIAWPSLIIAWSRSPKARSLFAGAIPLHHNEQKRLSLSIDEFLRRFLLHVLPKGFVRIRNFGFLANRRRTTLLPLCFHLLGAAPQAEQDISGSADSCHLWLCPKCGGPMQVIERLTAIEIQLRSPPALVTAAA
jgi:hypothetical protein